MKMLYAFSLWEESPDNIVNIVKAQLIVDNDRCCIWSTPSQGYYNRLCYIKRSGDYYWYNI